MESTFLVVVATAIVAIIVYVLTRKINFKSKGLLWVKFIVLIAGVLFLLATFYSKEQYGFMAIVSLGALAFFKLMKDTQN